MSQLDLSQSALPRRRMTPSPPDEESKLADFINSLPDYPDPLDDDDEGVDLPLIDSLGSLHPSMPALEVATQDALPPPSPPPPQPTLTPIRRNNTPPSIYQPFPHWDDPDPPAEEEKKRQPTPPPPRLPPRGSTPPFPRWDSPATESTKRQRTVPDSDLFVDPNAPFSPPEKDVDDWYLRFMSQPREDDE